MLTEAAGGATGTGVSHAVDAIERLLQAESEAVILAAAKDILDRGGLKAAHRIEVDTEITVVRPW